MCCGGDYTLIVCSHDHKVAAANTTEMLVPTTPTDPNPISSTPPRRSHHHGSGQIIKATQLRLPVKKSGALNYREGLLGSMDHISLGASTPSIRKLKSDLYAGPRIDRSRTGSTPLSDAPSEQGTSAADDKRSISSQPGGAPRTSTPTSIPESSEGRHGSNPDLSSHSQPPPLKPRFDPIRSGDADSIVSDPCDHGDESSSDDDASCANTDGQFPQDAYSEEDGTIHRSAQSVSEKGLDPDQQSVSKNLPESFRLPIMPFPPTADIVPATSARSLSRSMVTAARLRTRQRGLERRLGIADTWACERLISKQSPPADVDLITSCHYPSQEIIHEEGSQTARERSRADIKEASTSQRHRRTTSEQNVYLNSLKESLKNVGDSKMKILNYGKLLESVEERLLAIAARQSEDLQSLDGELSSVLKLLDADEHQKKIGSFFEATTVEHTIKIVQQLSEALDANPGPNNSSTVH